MKLRDAHFAISSFVFTLLWVCMNGVPLHAQTVGGTILGLVQDQQGGGVPKAEVSARSLDTGAIRKSVSTDNGEYRITGVPAGSYEISPHGCRLQDRSAERHPGHCRCRRCRELISYSGSH